MAETGIAFTRPPQKFSAQQIEDWIRSEAGTIRPNLPVKVLTTEAWSDYVNYHHFVPLSVEGVPDGYVFDYNWVEGENPRRRLPTAEVTESGAFLFWGDRCNYYDLTEQECRDFIRLAVKHEAHHFDQWQRIAVSALSFLGYDVNPSQLPSALSDLSSYEGATEAFMRVWADPGHYQCREVEAYTTQIENGEMSDSSLGGVDFQRRLQTLHTYANGDENSAGCAHSKWASEFSPYLEKAGDIFKKHDFKPATSGK